MRRCSLSRTTVLYCTDCCYLLWNCRSIFISSKHLKTLIKFWKIVEKPDKCALRAHKHGKRIIPHTHTRKWCNTNDERKRKILSTEFHILIKMTFLFSFSSIASSVRPISPPLLQPIVHTSHILTLDTMLPCAPVSAAARLHLRTTDTADKQFNMRTIVSHRLQRM